MLHLKVATDPGWATAAATQIGPLLVDHAHCELKAAASALSLVARHADDPHIVRALSRVAREEIAHFEQVLDHVDARRLPLGPPPRDAYVTGLREAVAHAGPSEVRPSAAGAVDRLLSCALIEARSCERFGLLAAVLAAETPELAALYEELRAAEAGHHTMFVDLAALAADADHDTILARLDTLAEAEASVVLRLAESGAVARIHG